MSVCAFGQPQSSNKHKHCTSLLSPIQIRLVPMSPWRSLDIQIWAPMSNSTPKPGELGQWCCICRSPLPCTDPQGWQTTDVQTRDGRNQDLKSRNLTSPDVGSFKPLSLLPPAIVLQELVTPSLQMHKSDLKIGESRRIEKQQPDSILRKAGEGSD